MGAWEQLLASLYQEEGKPDFSAGDSYAEPAALANSLGDVILQAAPSKRFGTGESIAGALITGLLGGGLGELSRDYQDRQKSNYRDVLLGNITAKPEDMEQSLFDIGSNRRDIFGALAKREDQIASRQAGAESRKELLKAFLENPQKTKRALEMLEGKDPAPLVSDPATASGPRSYDEKLQSLAQRFMDEQGATPNAAFDAAAQALKPDRAEMEAAQKRVDALREQATAMEQVADIAEAGVKGAGNTGGALGGVRDVASRLWAIVSPEESDQRASQALLDSVAPDVIKASRAAGAGAMSDPEMRAYLGAGPTSNKTPEENSKLIEKTRNVAKVQREYADFIDWYRNENSTLTGADQIWQEYKRANPIFVEQNGALEFNTNRPSWRAFLAGGGDPTAPNAPTQSMGGETIVGPDGNTYIFKD